MAYKPYEESEELKKAQQALQQQLSQKPGSYQSAWKDALEQAVQNLMDRESFRYDASGDPLYQNYRQQYLRDGRLAMLDTLGQAQTMTGGYGNSYAQGAAQQAYAGQLQNLGERIPELYQLALSRYGLEGQTMSDRLSYLQQQEDRDYSRWEDQLAAWQQQTGLLSQQYTDQRQQEYDRYLSDRDYQLKLEQAAAEQQRWQAEFDEAKRQYEQTQAAKTTAARGGGSYAGNQGYDAATVRKAQEFVGTAADGLWGKNSKAAAKAKGYGSLQEVIAAMGGRQEAATTPAVIVNAEEAVRRLAQAGTDKNKLSAYIGNLADQRKITYSQAAQLRQLYC